MPCSTVAGAQAVFGIYALLNLFNPFGIYPTSEASRKDGEKSSNAGWGPLALHTRGMGFQWTSWFLRTDVTICSFQGGVSAQWKVVPTMNASGISWHLNVWWTYRSLAYSYDLNLGFQGWVCWLVWECQKTMAMHLQCQDHFQCLLSHGWPAYLRSNPIFLGQIFSYGKLKGEISEGYDRCTGLLIPFTNGESGK